MISSGFFSLLELWDFDASLQSREAWSTQNAAWSTSPYRAVPPVPPQAPLLTRAEQLLCTGQSPVISQVWAHWIFTRTIWNVSILQKRKLRYRAVRLPAQSHTSPVLGPSSDLAPFRQAEQVSTKMECRNFVRRCSVSLSQERHREVDIVHSPVVTVSTISSLHPFTLPIFVESPAWAV